MYHCIDQCLYKEETLKSLIHKSGERSIRKSKKELNVVTVYS